MYASIKSVDNKTWKAIINGWYPPTNKDAQGLVVSFKDEKYWDDAKDEAALGNSRTLNSITLVLIGIFLWHINTYKSAKKAWKILQVAHEGTSKVRSLRLQLLTTKFQAMNMLVQETISEFNVLIRDVSNDSLTLRVPMNDEKFVRKILRSLPERYEMKIIAIEKVHDLSQMKVDELIRSVMTYELSLG